MQYSELLCEEYLPKIFYYCLKKTGNEHKARELTSDICYEILKSLQNGVIPQHFSAYVWKIAGNRYCTWVRNKNSYAQLEDIDEQSIQSDESVEDSVILNDELLRLRRELSLIRREYREILVAHYFEEKSVSVIAKELNLPLGTVKTRLQNSRKKLKEGMNMAREFGVRSYNPDEIDFIVTAGMIGQSTVTDCLKKKLHKNILLTAYRNPSTIEELSLELGVASVYMEEEVEELVNHELLKHKNGKFLTNMCIISRQTQADYYDRLYADIDDIFAAISAYIDRRSKLFDSNDVKWNYGFLSDNDTKWALLMNMTDNLWQEALEQIGLMPDENYPKHADGSDWIITGYEKYYGKKPCFVSLEGCENNDGNYSDKVHFMRYYFPQDKSKYCTSPMLDESNAICLRKIALGNKDKVSDDCIKSLTDYGYLKDGVPNVTVLSKEYFVADTDNTLIEMRKSLVMKFAGLMNFYCDKIKSDIPEHLRNNTVQISNAFRGFILRGAVIEQALKTGYVANSDSDSVCGAILIV